MISKIAFLILVLFISIRAQEVTFVNENTYSEKQLVAINHGNIYDKPYGKLLGLVNKNDTLKIITKKGNWFHTEKGWIESSFLGIEPNNYLSYNLYVDLLKTKNIQDTISLVFGTPANISFENSNRIYIYNNLFDQRFNQLILMVNSNSNAISAKIILKQPVDGKKSIENLFQIPPNAILSIYENYVEWKFGKDPIITIRCKNNNDKFQVSTISLSDQEKWITEEKTENQNGLPNDIIQPLELYTLDSQTIWELRELGFSNGILMGLLIGPWAPPLIYSKKENITHPLINYSSTNSEKKSERQYYYEDQLIRKKKKIVYQYFQIGAITGAVLWSTIVIIVVIAL